MHQTRETAHLLAKLVEETPKAAENTHRRAAAAAPKTMYFDATNGERSSQFTVTSSKGNGGVVQHKRAKDPSLYDSCERLGGPSAPAGGPLKLLQQC